MDVVIIAMALGLCEDEQAAAFVQCRDSRRERLHAATILALDWDQPGPLQSPRPRPFERVRLHQDGEFVHIQEGRDDERLFCGLVRDHEQDERTIRQLLARQLSRIA